MPRIANSLGVRTFGRPMLMLLVWPEENRDLNLVNSTKLLAIVGSDSLIFCPQRSQLCCDAEQEKVDMVKIFLGQLYWCHIQEIPNMISANKKPHHVKIHMRKVLEKHILFSFLIMVLYRRTHNAGIKSNMVSSKIIFAFKYSMSELKMYASTDVILYT